MISYLVGNCDIQKRRYDFGMIGFEKCGTCDELFGVWSFPLNVWILNEKSVMLSNTTFQCESVYCCQYKLVYLCKIIILLSFLHIIFFDGG